MPSLSNIERLNILNLGAAGFIGAHLTARLLREGHTVIGVDAECDKVLELRDAPGFTFLQRDIRERGFDLDGLVAEADVVVDLIAHANPSLYVSSPLEVFRLNFDENLRIAEACVRHGRRLVQFSSCEVYGKTLAAIASEHLKEPDDPALATFSEDDTPLIMGPVSKHRWIYASAKQLLERVIHAYGLREELRYSTVRPFNFIGPKIDYLPGDSGGVPRVFSFFMEALLEGTEMPLVDGGRNRRCYTYIDDAVECIVLIIEDRHGVCDGETFNIGSPYNEVSIRGLAEEMRRIYRDAFGTDESELPALVPVPADEFYGPGYDDSDRRIPDISKARRLLGWEPRFGLRETLERSMRYYVEADRERALAGAVGR